MLRIAKTSTVPLLVFPMSTTLRLELWVEERTQCIDGEAGRDPFNVAVAIIADVLSHGL